MPSCPCKQCDFSKECAVKQVKRRFPIINWLPKITLSSFLYDLAGGLTVGLTAIPQSLAYAQLASMPVQFGLYTTIVSSFTYCAMGTARDVSLGPTSLISLMTGGLVDETGILVHQLLCFFSGIIMVIFAFLRLEVFLNIFPLTVTTGFTSAAAVIILGSQIKYFFGISGLPRSFVQLIPAFFRKIPETNLHDFIAGLIVLAFLLIVQYTVPPIIQALSRCRQTKVTKVAVSSLIVFSTLRAIIAIVVSASVAFVLANNRAMLQQHSADCLSNTTTLDNNTSMVLNSRVGNCTTSQTPSSKIINLTLTGPVPRGLPKPELPPFLGIPLKDDGASINDAGSNSYLPESSLTISNLTISSNDSSSRDNNSTTTTETKLSLWTVLSKMGIGTIILPVVSTIELLAVGQALSQRNGYRIDASQEILTCGVAHLIGAFLNAYPSSSSISRSALNSQCNIKTPLCSFFTASLVLIAAATIADITLPYVPKSCLAAVVIAAALGMIEIHMMKLIWKVNRIDMLPTGITFVACLVLDIEYGILIGVVAALAISALLSMRSIRSTIAVKPIVLPSISSELALIVKIPQGEIRYPCADTIKKLCKKTGSHCGPIILDCSDIREVDFATIAAFLSLARNPSKKNCVSSSFPMYIIGLDDLLLVKFQNAITVLGITMPTYRKVHFAANVPAISISIGLTGSMANQAQPVETTTPDEIELVDNNTTSQPSCPSGELGRKSR